MPADDPTFPSLHIRPATGWINDPNGISCVDQTTSRWEIEAAEAGSVTIWELSL